MKENKNPFIQEFFFLSSEMHIFLIFIFKICAFLNEFNNVSTISHHSILTFFLKFEFYIFCGIAHNFQPWARQFCFDLTKLLRKPDATRINPQIKNSDTMNRSKKLNIWLELKSTKYVGANLIFTINSSFIIFDPQLW